jgi:TIR domain
MSDEKNKEDFIYDVAFSFAGERRGYVSEVYRILKDEYNVRVYYDQDKEIKIENWGEDLGEIHQKVYEEQSKWCLLFISKEYKEKVWTTHEKRSALARAILGRSTYILPACFDDTKIDGIPSTTVYIDISNMTPEELSEYVLGKIGRQVKKKDTLTDSKIPDIRVNVNYTPIIKPDKIEHVLCINVSNYDKGTVFLQYPKINLKNRIEHFPIIKDDILEKHIFEIGKLEPGNSFKIYINPNNYSNHINELDNIIVNDKIGRIFKGNPDELNKAIDNWSKSK